MSAKRQTRTKDEQMLIKEQRRREMMMSQQRTKGEGQTAADGRTTTDE